ncbi:MAG: hypothetical protein CM1200mP36_06940 [Gammaproteobacteria bacterium]|nr:MAG: hypothetical protein CM1200mP36_06940 [Gammaproteobacteria bacterium]
MWMAEGDAMVALRRSGWTADQLTPGDRIEITGKPSRSGANMIGWNTLQLADGPISAAAVAGGRAVTNHGRELGPFREQRGQ